MFIYPRKFTKEAANKVEKMFNSLSQASQNRILGRAVEGKAPSLTQFERRLPEAEQLKRLEAKQQLANANPMRDQYTVIKGIQDGLFKKIDYINNLARMLRANPELVNTPKYSKYKRGLDYINKRYRILQQDSIVDRNIKPGDPNQQFKFVDTHPLPAKKPDMYPPNSSREVQDKYYSDLSDYNTYQRMVSDKPKSFAVCKDEFSEDYLGLQRHEGKPPMKGIYGADPLMFKPITREDVSPENIKGTLARLFAFNHELNEAISSLRNTKNPFNLRNRITLVEKDKFGRQTIDKDHQHIGTNRANHDSLDVLLGDVKLSNGHPQLNLLNESIYYKNPYTEDGYLRLVDRYRDDKALEHIQSGNNVESLLSDPSRGATGEQRFLESILGFARNNNHGALYRNEYIDKRRFNKAKQYAKNLLKNYQGNNVYVNDQLSY